MASPSELHIEVRASGSPARLAPDIRRIVAELGPDLPLIRPMTQHAQFAQSYRDERLFSRLAAERHSNPDLRRAARRDRVVWTGGTRQPRRLSCRMALGVPLAIAGSRFLESMLFGVSTRDPWSYAGALGAAMLLAVVASLMPARRAMSVDPMIALRSE